jgi:glutamate carboxypeptidase
MKIRIILLFLLIDSSLSAQTKKENEIISSIDYRNYEAIALLKKVVNINSGTMNFEGVRKIGKIFSDELKAIGFETRWVAGDSFNRAGHLISIHKGKKGPKILLIGHLDTVFERDSPFQSFTLLNDSIMKGPGASDMKGGDVVIILAM